MLLLRVLRLRYKVSLVELAQAVDVSHQLISDLELGKRSATLGEQSQIARAFECVIQNRTEKLARLADEFSAGRCYLLEPINETEGTT